MSTLLPVDEALRIILANVSTVARTENLPLRQAAGRVLAEDVLAKRTQPSFDASAMDGWALRSAETIGPPRKLTRIGEAAAGHAFPDRIKAGETVRIFTGAPVPEGADAVLIQENARVEENGAIVPLEPVRLGQNIRPAGVDFTEDTVLLTRSTVLSPGAIALAASGGHPYLRVHARPKIAILATGDELVLPGESVGPSQIVASNTFGIAALVEACGGEVIDCGIARDTIEDISSRLDFAVSEGADVVVTIGGASVGDHDLVAPVLEARGIALDFWKVAMRPGKPLMAGRSNKLQVLGLPGNPASSMVTGTVFLAPLVHRLAGLPESGFTNDGILGSDMPENGMRTDFVRAVACRKDNGTFILEPLARQDSSLLSIYAKANALIVRPPHAAPAVAGSPCRFITLA